MIKNKFYKVDLIHCLSKIEITKVYFNYVLFFSLQSSLHYDVSWVTFHTLFVATTCFMWHLLYCYPARLECFQVFCLVYFRESNLSLH